jgi:hypothetical protein
LCEFFSLKDKHLTSCKSWLGWTTRDAKKCFHVPIERWTWREGLHWKLHNLIQVPVFFKISFWKFENSFFFELAGPLPKHPQCTIPTPTPTQLWFTYQQKIVWFILISLGGQYWLFSPFGDRPLWLVHHPKQKKSTIDTLTHY